MRVLRIILATVMVALAAVSAGMPKAEAATNARILAIGSDGNLYAKDPGVSSPWLMIKTGPNLLMPTATTNRIAVLERTGTTSKLWVKEGGLTAPWTLVAENVADYDMTNARVAFIYGSLGDTGPLFMKDGSLGAPWMTMIGGGAGDVSMINDRISVMVSDGASPCYANSGWCNTFSVFTKKGSASSSWIPQVSGIEGGYCAATCEYWLPRLGVTDTRILVESLGAVWAGEDADFYLPRLTNDARYWAMADNRICITIGQGIACKVGAVTGSWYQATNELAYPFLGEGRFGWVTANGANFYAADTNFTTTPSLIMNGVRGGAFQKASKPNVPTATMPSPKVNR